MFDKIIIESEHFGRPIEELLLIIIHNQNKMSTQNDALVAGIQKVSDNLTKIQTGVTTLVSQLPKDGGLTADETASLGSSLVSLVSQSDAVVATVPAPVVAESPAV